MINSDLPVFAFFAEGDQKEKLKNWPFCHLTSYEQAKNLTVCIIKAEHLNRTQRRHSGKRLLKTIATLGIRPLSLKYFANGFNITQFWLDNNFLN